MERPVPFKRRRGNIRRRRVKRTLILAAAGLASTLLAVAPANAQFGRWTDRGWRTVAYTRVDGRDTDTIRLRGHIRERAIRVCAINAPLNLRDFDIRYQNGGHQDVSTRRMHRPRPLHPARA